MCIGFPALADQTPTRSHTVLPPVTVQERFWPFPVLLWRSRLILREAMLAPAVTPRPLTDAGWIPVVGAHHYVVQVSFAEDSLALRAVNHYERHSGTVHVKRIGANDAGSSSISANTARNTALSWRGGQVQSMRGTA